jgi:hypothetical protein
MNRRRVSIKATRIAGGKLNATLRIATLKLKRRASLSLGLNHIMLGNPYDCAGLHAPGSIMAGRSP